MIEFTRGDTQPLKFKIKNSDGTDVLMSDITTLIMTCRKYNSTESTIAFQKVKTDFNFEDEYYHVVINPADTETLDYGEYNFDIEVTLTNNYRKTLKSMLTITEEDTITEVTIAGDVNE